ncbi:MAG: hypothetical protein LBB72_04580 [Spirochaetaceae bacterium]|jgi:hypothetical protein|nr:hypothetical protein [Spirochaetaceae bacterium]
MPGSGFRLIDFFVILLCLFGAAYSFKLFWFDLFYTINSRNEKPLGIITSQYKTVKRQFRDSVRWDRLIIGAPLYEGDLIRVAELSSLAFKREDIQVEYVDYQMRRILPLTDGFLQIEGNVIVTAEKGGIYYLNGSRIEAGVGTVIKSESGDDGVSIQVLEGGEKVKIERDGKTRELDAGEMLDWDTTGNERSIPNAVVRLPRPNARYLKNSPQPISADFAWKRVNMASTDALYLEIAEDPNFARIVSASNTFDETVRVSLDAGPWHWRLSFAGSVLAKGYFTIVDASGPVLISPVKDSRILYSDALPSLSFQWSKTEGASEYYLEVCETDDFTRPRLRRQVAANFLLDSTLGPGTWYWHILPIFPAGFTGSAVYSSTGSFHIEQGDKQEVVLPELVIPEIPPELKLELPALGTVLPGLTALRQPTVFRWDYTGEVGESRFVLSANPDPTVGQPVIELLNPGKIIRVNRLDAGIWYWTVEAKTPDGLKSVAEPRRLEVQAIPLLPAPGGRSPAAGYRIGVEELRARRIDFTWNQVPGANGYILTIYRQSTNGLQQIIRTDLINRTRWTLTNLGILDNGSFVWQVEAVNSRGNTIEQRGRTADNLFILNIPRPAQPRVHSEGLRMEEVQIEGAGNSDNE